MFFADDMHVYLHMSLQATCVNTCTFAFASIIGQHKSHAFHCSCSLLNRAIMEVKLRQNFVLTANGVNWTVPPNLLSHHLGYTWVKIRASCYGLARMLAFEPTHGKNFVSFKGSPGLESLLHMRNSNCNLLDNEKHLFHSEAPAKKKRKVKAAADPSAVNIVHLDLGTHGQLKAMKATKKREDLIIPLDAAYIKMFLEYMYSEGISFETPSRKYEKSGNFTKEALAANSSKGDDEEADSAGEDEDDDGDEQAAAGDES